jgi:RND family efflux transporter MFP subunit
MNTNTENRLAILSLATCTVLGGCSPDAPTSAGQSAAGGSWSVTAWADLHEVFPEVDALIAGEPAQAHTHVTLLDGFTPMSEGEVEIVLESGSARQSFRATEASRPGIFNVEVRPDAAGEYDLSFLIRSSAGTEEIRGGRVRVGTRETPGGLTRAPAPRGASAGGEPLPFLKEEQWRSDFATAWVREGSLPQAVEGVVRVRPPAGGDATITAPVDAVLLPDPWPYPGRRVGRGAELFRLVPRVAAGQSLATLEAERNALETELATAEGRLARLRDLYEIEATSRRELEEAEQRVSRVGGRFAAAERDLEAARSAREGGNTGATTVSAPFAGEISALHASPGEIVAAGAPLARLVRTDSVWLEVSLPPAAARQLGEGVGGVVIDFPEGSSARIEEGVRLISIAPEVNARTGTVAALLEVPPSPELILGTTASAQVLLSSNAEGVVVPATSLIDDGGVTVVYLQLSGERFARQPVRVASRQGGRAIVEGLIAGQRLVTRGGEAIRRSSLMSSGEAHGHVH